VTNLALLRGPAVGRTGLHGYGLCSLITPTTVKGQQLAHQHYVNF